MFNNEDLESVVSSLSWIAKNRLRQLANLGPIRRGYSGIHWKTADIFKRYGLATETGRELTITERGRKAADLIHAQVMADIRERLLK